MNGHPTMLAMVAAQARGDVLATRPAIPRPRHDLHPTPTGVLVYQGEPHTPEWFAARNDGITATDLVKIMGLSRYGNATSVWMSKTGRGDVDETSEAAQWGLDLEPVIARRWAERHASNVRPVGVLAHQILTRHRASLDGLVDVCPDGDGPCGVQYKCRSAFKAGQWREDVPDDVYVQEQWECHVSGFRHMHVAVLIGGNQLRSYRVDADAEDMGVLVARADDVWAAVEANEPPADAPSSLLASVLRKLYPTRDGQAKLLTEEVNGLLQGWRAAKAAATQANAGAKRAKAAVEAAEALMLAALGPHLAAFTDDSPEPAFAVVTKPRAGYTVAATETTTIEVNKAWTPAEGAVV